MSLKGKHASFLHHNSSLFLALVTPSLSTQKAQISAWLLALSCTAATFARLFSQHYTECQLTALTMLYGHRQRKLLSIY